MLTIFWVLTRVVIIPFKEPSIRARNEEQRSVFTSLKQLKNNANTSMGYYVKLGKIYRQEGVFEIDDYEEKVSKLLPNCGGCVLKGYANLISFTIKVPISLYIYSYYIHVCTFDR